MELGIVSLTLYLLCSAFIVTRITNVTMDLNDVSLPTIEVLDPALAVGRCPVYTYFEDIIDYENEELPRSQMLLGYDHYLLLKLWLRNWYHHGWHPVVLGKSDAEAAPYFLNYQERFRKFPTVNNPRYELACFTRWMAFAHGGGGAFTDYDIYNFPRSNVPLQAEPCGQGPLLSYPDFLPMFLFGNKTEVERLILEYVRYELEPSDQYNGRPHISDMIIARKRRMNVFHDLIPNPPKLAHLSAFAKHLASEKSELAKKLSKAEWARKSLLLNYQRNHRIIVLSHDPTNNLLEPSIEQLLSELAECLEPAAASTFLDTAFQLRDGDLNICKFELVSALPTSEQSAPSDTVIIIVEDPFDKFVRLHQQMLKANKTIPTLEQIIKASPNMLLRQLTGYPNNQSISDNELSSLLEQAKAILTRTTESNSIIVGIADRILDTKLILEYSLGLALNPPTVPYIKPNETFIDLDQYGASLMEQFKIINSADYQLYHHVALLCEEKLNIFKRYESTAILPQGRVKATDSL